MNRRQFHTRGLFGFSALLTALVLPASVATLVQAAEPASTTPLVLSQRIAAGQAPAILDVRSRDEFASGHIPGAINLPVTELKGRLGELAAFKNVELVVHCEVGPRAGMASWILERNGFDHLVELRGHMQAWRNAGLPMAR